MNPSLSKKLRIALFASVILFVAFFSMFYSTSTNALELEEIETYNDGWDIYINGLILEDDEIPTVLDAKPNDTITIRKVLDDDFSQSQTILIRGSLQNVTAQVDGQVIYDKDFEENIFDTYASIYHFINIPDSSEGKVIEISLVSPYTNMSGTINDIYYGSPSMIEDHLLNTHGFKVFIAFFMLTISIIFIVTNLLFFSKDHPYNNFLGFFGLFISLWLFAESRIVQLFINNDFLIGSLAYISLAMAPISIVAFIKAFLFKNDRYLYSGLCVVYTINMLVILFLHITGIAAFFETAISTIILISIGFVLTIVILLKSYIQSKKIIYRNFLIIFIAFSFFLFIEVFAFINKNFRDTAVFASIGISLIMLVIFMINIVILSFKLRDSFEKQAYEEIARTDQLTKAKSRFAFENDLDHLFYQQDKAISMIYFDFDDLKFINDHYGHIEGDKTLILGFSTIKHIFGKYGECYRIGGDEFACVSNTIDPSLFNQLKESLNKMLTDINQDLEYNIRISVGYTLQNFDDDVKPSDLLQKADHNMYLDKAKNKAQVQ